FIWRPKADSPPVIGPATAMVTSCANAALDNAIDAPNARPMSFSDFMRYLAGDRLWKLPGSPRFKPAPFLNEFLEKSPAKYGHWWRYFVSFGRTEPGL